MDEIATGKRPAYTRDEPAPTLAGRSFGAMIREALAETAKPTHVLATRVPQVMRELERAAMAMDADWNLLARLLIDTHSDGAKDQPVPQQPERHVYKREKDLGMILDALRAAGFDPKALPPREPGKATPKAVVRKHLVGKEKLLSSVSTFNRSWEYGRETQVIVEVRFA